MGDKKIGAMHNDATNEREEDEHESALRRLIDLRKKQIRARYLDGGGDATALPVLDALDAAGAGPAEQCGNLGGASQLSDELPVRVFIEGHTLY
jgi:hypothetical protein